MRKVKDEDEHIIALLLSIAEGDLGFQAFIWKAWENNIQIIL
jgi:hypothetical protein